MKLLAWWCLSLAAPLQSAESLRPILENGLRVLDVAAHPDDEDASLLVWHAQKLHTETFVLYTTRGEGGQNAIGPELYDELGVVREDEILAACEVYGVKPFFVGFQDFGFSKRADETFERWGGQQEVVGRFTRFLRRLRPHRVYTNHDPDRGHGHHRATSISLREAIEAAADPTRFPDQLAEGLETWRVEALFERTSRRRFQNPAGDEPPPAPEAELARQITFEYDEVIGGGDSRAVAEYAHSGFVLHRSQGPWGAFNAQRPHRSTYHIVASATGITRVSDLDDHRRYIPGSGPAGTLTEQDLWLLWSRPELYGIDAETRLLDALEESLGLNAEIVVNPPVVGPGEQAEVVIRFDGIHQEIADHLEFVVHGPGVARKGTHGSTSPSPGFHYLSLEVDGDAPYTLPRHERRYGLSDALSRLPFRLEICVSPPQRRSWSRIVALPLELSPSVIARFHPEAMPLVGERRDQPFSAQLRLQFPRGRPATIELQAQAPLQLRESDANLPVPASDADLDPVNLPVRMAVAGEALATPGSSVEVSLEAAAAGSSQPSVAHAITRRIDLKIPPGLKVLFVAAEDRSVANALEVLGVNHRVVEPEEVADLDLGPFSNVVLDVRILGRSKALRNQSKKLLAYVEQGGHLLVLYHKSFEWNPHLDKQQVPAPYPLKLSGRRVCEEDAAVDLLRPDHPILSQPHRITQADFEGWVQERGLYFPHGEYAEQYEELLRCNDQGEDPLPGGLLFARSGNGTFSYCAYAIHRQLRAAHPGGYRLLVNLLALSQ